MVGNNAWRRHVEEWINSNYPNLTSSDYTLTSPDTIDYNCVAWAAEKEDNWWCPDAQKEDYWPANVPREETLDAFIQLFQSLGYKVCQNDLLEEGLQKIAIYTNSSKIPTHVSRQLPNGKWTSKLGSCEDIEHSNLEGLAGQPGYGKIACIMEKATTNKTS